MSAPTSFTVASYITINATTSDTSIDLSNIWIAVYGQLIYNQGSGTVPSPGQTYYLDKNSIDTNGPIPLLTNALNPAGPSTPDSVILPSYTLADWAKNLKMPVPAYTTPTQGLTQYTGRIILSVGCPVQAQISASGTVGSPSASNPIDPSTGTFCDFLEFTVQSNSDGSNNIDMDTSQVDSFALPLKLQFFQDNEGTQPFDYSFTGTAQNGSVVIENIKNLNPAIQKGILVTGDGITSPTFIADINNDRTKVYLNQPVLIKESPSEKNITLTLTALLGGPVGVQLNRNDIFGTGSASFATYINGLTAAQKAVFSACAAASPLRLITPKDLSETYSSPPYTDVFNNYFNETIDAFFLQYYTGSIGDKSGGGQTFSIVSEASGTSVTYTGTVVKLSSGNYVLQLSDGTNKFNIYYPFFTGVTLNGYTPVFPTAAAPTWLVKPLESPSQMVWGCDGVFADNTLQPNDNNGYVSFSAVLGDLENSIAAAFNRGIILNTPSTWGDTQTWFSGTANNNGIYNCWIGYWHQNGVAVNNLAYAFPYDDKYGTSTNMQVSNVGQVNIQLGSWGGLQKPVISLSISAPPIIQNGTIAITASFSAESHTSTPTGLVVFYLDGIALTPIGKTNTQIAIVNGVAQLTATCPALPDGNNTHTYTLTAVYFGDTNYIPWTQYTSVQLLNPPVFNVPAPPTIYLGKTLPEGTTVTLPYVTVKGTLALSTWVNGTLTCLAPPVSIIAETNPVPVSSYKVPLLNITGNLTKGSNKITNVSDFDGLQPTNVITGNGIPDNTTILTFTPPPPGGSKSLGYITMSNEAIETISDVTITCSGKSVGFHLQAIYTPDGGQAQAPIMYNFSPPIS